MRHILWIVLNAILLIIGTCALAAQTEPIKLASCPPKKPKMSAFANILPWSNTSTSLSIDVDFIDDSGLPCLAAPIEVTVPNKTAVTLILRYTEKMTPCIPKISVIAAPSSSPIADILGIIAKAGVVGLRAPTVLEQDYVLPELSDKVLTAESTCTHDPSKSTHSVKITYQNPARVSISAGIVFAPGVRSYGFKTTQTGVGAGGVVTTQNSLAVTGSPSVQFIPFSLVNLNYSGTKTFNLNAQLGLGVNPNLSSAKVEFFASPLAIGWHDVYFSPGFHIGQHEQLKGGFNIGELTPGSLSKVPIGWQYFTGFGFSISYNLKSVTKSSSSATASGGVDKSGGE